MKSVPAWLHFVVPSLFLWLTVSSITQYNLVHWRVLPLLYSARTDLREVMESSEEPAEGLSQALEAVEEARRGGQEVLGKLIIYRLYGLLAFVTSLFSIRRDPWWLRLGCVPIGLAGLFLAIIVI
ncbi:hypothetical protein ACFL3Z_01315 [Gemmatimonadota bacterium]